MMNALWGSMILASIVFALLSGRLDLVADGALDGASASVEVAVTLLGVYALWLGVLKIAERAGLVETIAKKMRPLMARLFAGVPKNHPAMGHISMNLLANMLGMGGAATPYGLKAMEELQRLNPHKDTATHDMCMLLIVNASSIQLIPMTIIGIRRAAGSAAPAEIIGSTLLVTLVNTVLAIILGKIMAGRGSR